MRRLDSGAPLRKAIKEAGLNIPRLAEATGLSPALVGFTVGNGKTAREDCSDRTAELIAEAIGAPLGDLFVTEPTSGVDTRSTSTPRRQMQMTTRSSTPLPERLLTQKELCGFLRKSSSWVDRQVRAGDFPVIYTGRSRRFDPHQVLEHLAQQRKPQQAA